MWMVAEFYFPLLFFLTFAPFDTDTCQSNGVCGSNPYCQGGGYRQTPSCPSAGCGGSYGCGPYGCYRMRARGSTSFQPSLGSGSSSALQLMRSKAKGELVRNPITIGGPGVICEIDETVLTKPKYNRGRELTTEDQWLIGGYERGSGRVFIHPITDRSINTLMPVIQHFIRPGSIIYSDCWSSYVHGIPKLPEGYEHYTVNHSTNFVDPTTGCCTNSIESTWQKFKARHKKHYGTARTLLSSYVEQFCWRQKFAGNDIMYNLWSQIAVEYKSIEPGSLDEFESEREELMGSTEPLQELEELAAAAPSVAAIRRSPSKPVNPNRAFMECCLDRHLPDACLHKCHFAVYNKDALTRMYFKQDGCPLEAMREIQFCAAQGRDHRECCVRNGVTTTIAGEKCLTFCDQRPGKVVQLDLSYVPCFDRFESMKNCFWSDIARFYRS